MNYQKLSSCLLSPPLEGLGEATRKLKNLKTHFMNKVLTRGIITIAAVNDGKDGHSLTAKAFIEGSYRNGRTKGVKSYVKVFYDGQEVKDFTVSYRYKGAGQADWVKPQTNKEVYWVDAQRDGSTIYVEYVVEYKGLKALATGRLDNIQDGRNGADGTDGENGKDSVSYALVPLKEKVVAYLTDDKKKRVDVRLKYGIRKSLGERVSFVTDLAAEGMTLTEDGGLGGFGSADGEYGLQKLDMEYKERPDDCYVVTLTKGGNVVDRRVLPITFKPKVMFDFGQKVDGLDGEINGIAGNVSTLDGRVSGFETTIDHFSTEVKDKVSHSELKHTADGIVAKVGSSVNANLLWGSDLDLSQVQDVINRAYAQGDIIKKETEKKAEWKRSRDNADSDDDRMRYQEGMDDCDRKIAQAQGEVAKCKEAIRKRLGIVTSGDMEFGNRDMFEYLKGKGVGGSDAIHFKNVYKREGWAKWTNICWQGVPLKPNTKYTISVWVKFKSYGRKGRMYVDSASDDGRYCFGGYLYKEHYYDRADIDEWQRVRYVFNSGASKRLSGLFFSCIADEEEGAQCEIWLCHPKLEEGEVATPWCAYDGTVDALLDTGLDIRNRKFTATADNFMVQNNRGEKTFMVDEDGALRSIDTSGKGCIVLRPHAGYISILDTETGKDRAMVNQFGIYAIGVRGNDIILDTSDKTGKRAAFDISGMFSVECFSDESIGALLNITMDSLPYIGDNSLRLSQLYIDGKNNLKINTGEPTVKLLHPNESYVMKSTDATIVADTKPNNDVWITLPKEPSVGMEVVIINTGSGWCYLKTDDFSKIFWDEVKTEEFVRQHTKISLLYVGGSDGLWIYVTEGLCGVRQ